jgi:hypothetical protein
MNENVYGYVRVSTKEQNLDRQLFSMREFGVPEKQLYQEKQSGKDFERPVYCRLIEKLKPGDTLVIKSIDRLGRNYDEILEQWRILTKEKKVDTEFLHDDYAIERVNMYVPLKIRQYFFFDGEQLHNYRGARYALARHTAGARSDRNADCGYCAPAFELCGPDRAGIYPATPGGGNRSRQGARRAFRTETQTQAR